MNELSIKELELLREKSETMGSEDLRSIASSLGVHILTIKALQEAIESRIDDLKEKKKREELWFKELNKPSKDVEPEEDIDYPLSI